MNYWTMFFLFGLNIRKTMNMVAISPVWIVMEECSIQINSSGYKAVKYGCFPCFTTK